MSVTLDPIALWPRVAPGSEAWTHQETSEVDPLTNTMAYKNVVVPTLTPVLPPEHKRNGTAVIVAPGGAFVALAWEHEALPTAEWFAALGVAAFALKYRVVRAPEPEEATELMKDPDGLRKFMSNAADICAEDGEQAVRVVRGRADEWGLDPARIGILGYSAGGTVALRTAVTADPQARPAFVANIYGAWLGRDVPSDAPPCFTVVAADDPACDWCLDSASAWRAAARPVELHVYERGGHGFALRKQGLPVDAWTDRLADWLRTEGLL
jgi:acetyl esterase/lipase